MRHGYFGRKFSRTKNERRRLFQGLARDLILHGKIETSLAKAKSMQAIIDKLITKAKQATEASRRSIMAMIADKDITAKLILESKTRFSPRTSGYTRIIRLGRRVGDASEQVLLQFVDEVFVPEVVQVPNVSDKKKAQVTPVVKPAKKSTSDKKETKPKVKTSRKK